MTDLYISYSMRERYWVSKLVHALESEGYSVWWEHVAVLGDDIRPDSHAALVASKQVLSIWSPLAVDDYWVLQDSKLAKESNKLLSVMHKPAVLPVTFSASEMVNLKHWKVGDESDAFYQSLLSTLKTLVEPSQKSEAQRKKEIKERKLRIQAEQLSSQKNTTSSQNRFKHLRQSVSAYDG